MTVLNDFEEKRAEAVSKKLKNLLKDELGFDDIFSKWLSKNLCRLKESSVKLLEDLDKESYMYIRISTVTQFDFDKERGLFKSRARNIYAGF